jgi:predicted Zn-dependent protease
VGARIAILSLAVCGLASAATAPDYVAQGNDHYFNLEYDEALTDYYQAMRVDGESAGIWNHIATTLLYKELHRLGKLETSAFRGDNAFLGEEKPQPDPEANKRFLGALFQARRLAEAKLEKSPKDPDALFSLSSNYALLANYEFMIDKSYFSALRNGTTARKYSDELLASDPKFVDGYLVPGVQEYVVGSLPWAVKMLAALGGYRGNKAKGEEWVTRVAENGRHMQTEAKVLLTLLYRRENRPLEAARVLDELIAKYPRNYVLRLELGSMLLDAQEKGKALDVFRTTQRMVREDQNRFGRMPERLQKALQRKLEELEKAPAEGSLAAAAQ